MSFDISSEKCSMKSFGMNLFLVLFKNLTHMPSSCHLVIFLTCNTMLVDIKCRSSCQAITSLWNFADPNHVTVSFYFVFYSYLNVIYNCLNALSNGKTIKL